MAFKAGLRQINPSRAARARILHASRGIASLRSGVSAERRRYLLRGLRRFAQRRYDYSGSSARNYRSEH